MKRHAPIALVLAATAWLLLAPFESQLEVNADSERDLFRTASLVEQGVWPANGPAIDYLPLTLGPGWYVAAAPALLLHRSPYAVHALHTLLVLLGIGLVYAALLPRIGTGAALLAAWLLGTSQWLTQVMVRVWHNAMLPGVALCFLALLVWGLGAATARRRSWALAGAWLLLLLLMLLHVVSVAYGATLVGVHALVLRRDGRAGGWRPLAVATVVAGGLLVGYCLVLAGLDWAQVGQLRADRLGGGLLQGAGAVLGALPEYLTSGWSDPGPKLLLAVGVLLAGATGAVDGLRRRDVLTGVLVLQVLLGVAVAAVMAGLSVAPRYFNAIVPAAYVLAALGLPRLGLLHARALPIALGAAVALALWGGWLQWPIPASGVDRTHATPSLSEQRTLVGELDERWQLSYRALEQRVHGPILGGLTAFRYLAWVRGLPERTSAGTLPPTEDILVGPEGFPEPASALARLTIDGGSHRRLALVRFERRFDPTEPVVTVGGRPCPIALPYRWSHLVATELEPFGIRPGFDLAQCGSTGPLGRLTVALPRLRGEGPLHVHLDWFDVASRYADVATLVARDASGRVLDVERLGGEMLEGVAVFRLTPPPAGGALTIELGPVQTLAVVDVY